MAHVAFPDERIINPNSQQYAEIEFETLHANDNSLCGAAFTVNGADLRCMYVTYYMHVNN